MFKPTSLWLISPNVCEKEVPRLFQPSCKLEGRDSREGKDYSVTGDLGGCEVTGLTGTITQRH